MADFYRPRIEAAFGGTVTMAKNPFAKKLTPTSCSCRGAGTCKACRAKAAKARAMKMPKAKGY